jgi:hypothetical protein
MPGRDDDGRLRTTRHRPVQRIRWQQAMRASARQNRLTEER